MHDLSLTEQQFWALTPAQFNALCDRLDFERERADLRAGIVASTIANVNRSEKQKPYTPQMFMPGYGGEEEGSGSEDMSAESILDFFKAAFPPKPSTTEEASTLDG